MSIVVDIHHATARARGYGNFNAHLHIYVSVNCYNQIVEEMRGRGNSLNDINSEDDKLFGFPVFRVSDERHPPFIVVEVKNGKAI